MEAHTLFHPEDDLFFDARRVIKMLRDPRSNARQVSRALERAPQLSEAINACAREHFRGRGRVQSTTHAVTLIGYRRLEAVVRSVAQQAYLALLDGAMAPSPALVRPPAPVSVDIQVAV